MGVACIDYKSYKEKNYSTVYQTLKYACQNYFQMNLDIAELFTRLIKILIS